jgi:hypothetical protein
LRKLGHGRVRHHSMISGSTGQAMNLRRRHEAM